MEREVLEFDALFVGAGPAGLAGAIHLSDLIDSHNRAVAAGAPGKPLGEMTIAVLEKSSTVGAHGISGAVLDPRAMRELLPDFLERGCPAETQVTRDDVYFMWEKSSFRLPLVPPMLQNHGNYVLSLGKLVAWMAGVAAGKGVPVLTDPHLNLQRFKTHPLVRSLLEGGKPVAYGAKAIPEGGWWAMPQLAAEGFLLCGDTGGFLNGARLKGVHLAIKSGMLAAETVLDCLLAGAFSKERLGAYQTRAQHPLGA